MTRWAGLLCTMSLLLGLSISMVRNGINPVEVFARTIAQADPAILQRELFRSAFAGFGLESDAAQANFRHEIFGAVLTAVYLSVASVNLKPLESRAASMVYRMSIVISVLFILLSLSRSVILALGVWPLLVVWRAIRLGRISPRQISVAALLLAAALPLSYLGLISILWVRFTQDTSSYEARDDLVDLALHNIADHPWIGGVETVGESSHNLVLDSWVRAGVFAAAAALVVTVLLASLWIALALRTHVEPSWMLPVTCALALPIVRIFTAGGGLLPPVQWVALGVVAGFLAYRREWRTSMLEPHRRQVSPRLISASDGSESWSHR